MNTKLQIHPIHWTQTIPIRHRVLWPDKSAQFCVLEGDEEALHFGAYIDEQLVGVASVFVSESSARLRKFATLSDFRNQGIGSALLRHAIQIAQEQGLQDFWCDARETALPFYTRFGMRIEGQRFYKTGIAYFKMSRQLS